ncbi:hypothetical protein [Phenylobacterium aquaticum]|uniref:hypothetical protein n=1 Tax=Phenylobacterium aquaticum TaxID=1763816 RepID=UPI001F5C817F|nr:hypothetical protein [Phenylobacterium aquaticum]MCI3135287.1 hypothetical protein [Phenylobacterium aquaticum]
MNEALRDIPDRILGLATAALTQANMHAVFMDPGSEHWPQMSILNTAHAGELFLKAMIASEHPLLIFKDLVSLDDNRTDELGLETLLSRGRTHDFEKLPQVLWATTGLRIPNPECFERLRRARNAIQHFCAPDIRDLSALSLEFIYTIIDPLIAECFGLFAIEYHEDHSVGYDYVVKALLVRELRFSIPDNFRLTEIRIAEEIEDASPEYQTWVRSALADAGKSELLSR